MNAALSSVLWGLGRTSLLLAIVGLAAALILRLARVRSPIVHRLACLATLLVGWTLVRVPIDVPWYAAPAPAPARAPLRIAVTQSPPAIDVVPPRKSPFVLPHYLKESEDASVPPVVIVRPLPVAKVPASESPARGPLVWRLAPVVLLSCWLAGIVAIVLWWIWAYSRFVWRLPAGLPAEQAWLDEWAAMQAKHGGRPIPLRVTQDIGPLVCRLPRGTELLVPLSVWQELSATERRAVLAHELAHHQRGDLGFSLAMRVLALPHWFNPVAWLAVRRFDEAAEWACDRAATADSATDYAKMLLRLSELASRSAPFSSAMSNIPLASRIKRIVKRESADSVLKRAVVIAFLFLALPLAAVQIRLVAQEAAPAKTQQLQNLQKVEKQPAVPPTANTVELPQVERPTAVQAAQQKMIDAAEKAFAATEQKYLSGLASLEAVFSWSNRWFAAELAMATSKQQRLEAAKAHLARLERRQAAVEKMNSLSKGADMDQLAAANYFVADAERRLAEIEAGEDTVALIRPPRGGATPAATLLPSPAPTLKPTATGPEVVPPSLTQPTPTVQPHLNLLRSDSLLYDGKTLDEWINALQTDLSPKLRTQALNALRVFASNGFGERVVEAVFPVMKNYSFWDSDSLQSNAIRAIQAVPAAERLPAIRTALASTNDNERMFAIRVIPTDQPKETLLPILLPALGDPNWQVASLAASALAQVDHDNPAVIDYLKKALKSSTPEQVRSALTIICSNNGHPFIGPPPSIIYPRLAADVLPLLASPDRELSQRAHNTLFNMGAAVLDPLLEIIAQGGANADTARKLYDEIDAALSPVNRPRSP